MLKTYLFILATNFPQSAEPAVYPLSGLSVCQHGQTADVPGETARGCAPPEKGR